MSEPIVPSQSLGDTIHATADDSLDAYRKEAEAKYHQFMLPGVDVDRTELVTVFASLPDEAFNYVVYALWQMAKENGGFEAPSKVALNAFSRGCEHWIKRKQDEEDAREANPAQLPHK